MWRLFLLAPIGAGMGYFAGCMKQKKRETRNCSPKKKEGVQSSLLNSPFNADMEEARTLTEQGQQPQGDLRPSYGEGIGVVGMISTGNQKIDELSLLLSQTADLLRELKGQLKANRNYMKNAHVFESVCHQHILAFQEDKLRTDANHCVNSGSGSVGTPSEENAANRSENKEYEAMLEDTQINFFEPNFSNHQRNILDFSESSIAMVEAGLCANGLSGHYSSSENKTPTPQLKISDADNYGVSPYELDCFLEKQQEKISELDMQLKSMEEMLYAKERELQQWKDRVRCLAEPSFGEDSPTFERASDANGRRRYLMHALSNSSSELSPSSAQEANSQLPWWPLSHCVQEPLESTARSKEQLDYSEKTACNYAGQTSQAYAEGMEASRLVSRSRDSIDASCIDFLNALADIESSRCQHNVVVNFSYNVVDSTLNVVDATIM